MHLESWWLCFWFWFFFHVVCKCAAFEPPVAVCAVFAASTHVSVGSEIVLAPAAALLRAAALPNTAAAGDVCVEAALFPLPSVCCGELLTVPFMCALSSLQLEWCHEPEVQTIR